VIKKLEKPRNLALRTLDSNRNVGRAPRELNRIEGNCPGHGACKQIRI
jgi:hypothetical protein